MCPTLVYQRFFHLFTVKIRIFSTHLLQRVGAKAEIDKGQDDGPEGLQDLFLLRLSHISAIKEGLIFFDIDS